MARSSLHLLALVAAPAPDVDRGSAAIAKDRATASTGTHGCADRESMRPVDEHTLLSKKTPVGAHILGEERVAQNLRAQLSDVTSSQARTGYGHRVAGHPHIGHSGSTTGAAHDILLLTSSDIGEDAMNAVLERLDREAIARGWRA